MKNRFVVLRRTLTSLKFHKEKKGRKGKNFGGRNNSQVFPQSDDGDIYLGSGK